MQRNRYETDERESRPVISDQLNLLKYLADVQGDVKKVITEDFVLAKLGQKDKEFIIEMIQNFMLIRNIMAQLKDAERKLTGELNMPLMEIYEKRIEDAYLTRIQLLTVLNRNVQNNWIVRMLAGQSEEEKENETEETDTIGMLDKIKEKINRKKENAQKGRTV